MIKWIKQRYHWLIAVLVFMEMIIYGGIINSASVFIQPISDGLGVSTTAYALAMMPYTVTCFLGTSFSGALFGRFGYKRVALVSLAIVSLSLVLTACCQSIAVFCVSKILFGLGYGACFTAGSVRIIKDWFWKHQGAVLGAVSMSTGLGGSLMTVLLSGVIEGSGWRQGNIVAAAMIAGIALLYLLLRDKPEQMGLKPYGYGEKWIQQKKSRHMDDSFPGLPLKEQLRRPMFYLMCFCVLTSCACIYTSSTFLVPHFRAEGFSAEEAAGYQSLFLLSLAGAKLLAGVLYDRFGAKPVMTGCMLCAVVGQLMLNTVSDPGLTYASVLIFSVAPCMTSIMIPLIASALFGQEGSMSVNGIFLGLSSLGSLISSPISSMCYDACGSYVPVSLVSSLINIGITALFLLLFAMAKKERAAFSEGSKNG